MKYSTQIKPISYIKANAAEVIKNVCETQQPYIITVNGEAKAVLQDVREYEAMQERMAMLEIIAQGQREYIEGKTVTLDEAIANIRGKASRKAMSKS
ncbi:MAG: type II toxin-antitoxin system Phd/YefM family antitoxin [Candidatus Kapabacteria bacterium]|nr:type II toxin-antitoxin system Phd/YefM family antitoxin [Candidatus Kapabacteria bacterium]